MSAVFIIILGGIFLVAAVAAIYVLVDKKVISNPLDYISSIFSLGGTRGTGGTVGTVETEDTEDTEDYDDDSPSYVDRFSPNKTVKGRYVWITRENPNSTTYRNAFDGNYYMYPFDTYYERAPINATEIIIIGKDGEILTEKTPLLTQEQLNSVERRYDNNNYVWMYRDDVDDEGIAPTNNELKIVWDGEIIEYCIGEGCNLVEYCDKVNNPDCTDYAHQPYERGVLKAGNPRGWSGDEESQKGARYEVVKTTGKAQLTPTEQAAKVDVYDQSGALPPEESDLLFNNDIDSETYEDNKEQYMTSGSTGTVDYIKIDLRSIKTITGIRIDSLYEISEHVYRNFNLHGVHVIITKQDSLDRPVAITPIISSTGTSHSFTFPGTQWDSDSRDDLELKFLQ